MNAPSGDCRRDVDTPTRFFNPYAEIKRHGWKNLPHWQQPGATYFVTFRLADSIPREKLDVWLEERDIWRKANPPPWNEAREKEYFRRFGAAIERWLDAGSGSCALREQAAAEVVGSALMFFHDERYAQHAWIVMPNHVHALFTLSEDATLESVLHSWKSFTSHQLGKLAGDRWPGWQRDYFDRIIRNEEHFVRAARYIRNNPEKANLRAGSYLLWESEAVKELLELECRRPGDSDG